MPRARLTDVRRAIDAVLVAAFGLALVVPPLLPSTFDESAENRRAAVLPALTAATLRDFPKQVESVFSDRFAPRTALTRWVHRVKLAMRVSPSPSVLLGKDGFLFYAGEDTIPEFLRTKPFSRRDLGTWERALAARSDFLAARGIRYLVLIPPNKETVYADEMPDRFRPKLRPGRLDQLLGALQRRTSVATLDLRPALAEARRAGLAYQRTDTHWNDRGAFAAARVIQGFIDGWFPQVKPLEAGAVVEQTTESYGGDLAGMLALRDVVLEREAVNVRVRRPRATEADPRVAAKPGTPPHAVPRAREVTDATLPSAVMLHDSFMLAPLPFLAENFRRSVFLGNHEFPFAVIDRERPDLVVEELIERYLMAAPPANPAELFARVPPPNTMPLGVDEPHAPGTALFAADRAQPFGVDLSSDGTVTAKDDDPYVVLEVTPFAAEDNGVVRVTMTAEIDPSHPRGARYAEVFWANLGKNFDQRASLRFVILRDGLPHTYRVPCALSRAWKGSIAHFRLDFPDLDRGARYRVSGIELDG